MHRERMQRRVWEAGRRLGEVGERVSVSERMLLSGSCLRIVRLGWWLRHWYWLDRVKEHVAVSELAIVLGWRKAARRR